MKEARKAKVAVETAIRFLEAWHPDVPDEALNRLESGDREIVVEYLPGLSSTQPFP